MSLAFASAAGSFEDRWIVYATARDCVQHHLERGTPSERFHGFHTISLAMGRSPVRLATRPLRSELEAIRARLHSLPIHELAISVRTQAVVNLRWRPSGANTTMLVSEWTPSPLDLTGARTLEDVFGHFIEALWNVCGDPANTLEIREL